jgi:hypothetical protein
VRAAAYRPARPIKLAGRPAQGDRFPAKCVRMRCLCNSFGAVPERFVAAPIGGRRLVAPFQAMAREQAGRRLFISQSKYRAFVFV